MSETYCVRLPLHFPEQFQIQGIDPPAKTEFFGHAAELSAEGGRYVVTVKGIASEEGARALLRKLHAGTCWAGLELKTGIRASQEPQKLAYCDDPVKAGQRIGLNRPVDVLIGTADPAVFREDARLAKLTGGSVTITKSIKPERFFDALRDGLEQARPEAFEAGDEAGKRIESAIELFVLSHFEPNTVPRFLLQCTALEVLAPPGPREPAHIAAVVDAWASEARIRADEWPDNETWQADFKRLAENVRRLKSISHGERIRRFARQALARAGVGDAEDKVKRLMDAYGARGRFLHEGSSKNIGGAVTDMNDILPLLLQAVLRQDGSSGLGESASGLAGAESDGANPVADTAGGNRAEAAIALVKEWLADESGYDEETWPNLKEALEQDRPSSRKLFGD